MKLNFRPPDTTSVATAVVAPNPVPRSRTSDRTTTQPSQLGSGSASGTEGVQGNEVVRNIEGGGSGEGLVGHGGGSGYVSGAERDNAVEGSSHEIRGTDGSNIGKDRVPGLYNDHMVRPVINVDPSIPLTTTNPPPPNAAFIGSGEHVCILDSGTTPARYVTSARTALVYVFIALAILVAPFFLPVVMQHTVRIANSAIPFEIRLKDDARDALSRIWADAMGILSRSHQNDGPWGPTIIWEGPINRAVEPTHSPLISTRTSNANGMIDHAKPVSATTGTTTKAIMQEKTVVLEQGNDQRTALERPLTTKIEAKEHRDILLGDSMLSLPKPRIDEKFPSEATKEGLLSTITNNVDDSIGEQISQVVLQHDPRVFVESNNHQKRESRSGDRSTSTHKQRDPNNSALVNNLLDGDTAGWRPYAVIRDGRLWIGPTMEGRLAAEIGRHFSDGAAQFSGLCTGARDVRVDFSRSTRIPGSIEVTAHCGGGASCNTHASIDDIRLLTVKTHSNRQDIASSLSSPTGYILEMELLANEGSNNASGIGRKTPQKKRVWGPLMGPLRVVVADDAALTITANCPQMIGRAFKIVSAAQLKMALARLDTMKGVKDGGASWRGAFRYDAHPQRHIGMTQQFHS